MKDNLFNIMKIAITSALVILISEIPCSLKSFAKDISSERLKKSEIDMTFTESEKNYIANKYGSIKNVTVYQLELAPNICENSQMNNLLIKVAKDEGPKKIPPIIFIYFKDKSGRTYVSSLSTDGGFIIHESGFGCDTIYTVEFFGKNYSIILSQSVTGVLHSVIEDKRSKF